MGVGHHALLGAADAGRGELLDGFGEVPLAEDTEAYELEIVFGSSVVRTVTDLTSGSYLYTAAEQATDFPGYLDLGRLVNLTRRARPATTSPRAPSR